MNDQSHYPHRVVLDGVPRIGFDVHLSPFPGSLYAVLEYLGQRPDYAYLMGVTGAAFRRLWHRDDAGNVGLLHFGDTPFRRVFDALGYAWRAVPAEKGAMLAAIKESLARRVPPISFGLLGPPEAGIVAGYDRDGAVLYGWSYFQSDFSRYYEQADWFEAMDGTMKTGGANGLIVISDQKPSPSPRDILVAALEWALDLESTTARPEVPDHVSGLSAYDAWADGLEADADYPPGQPDVMNLRAMIYGDQCIMLEERREAARFLRSMTVHAPPAAGHLEGAAAHFDEVADLIKALWPWADPSHTGAIEPLADARTRRELAGLVRRGRDKEIQAVARLQQALAALR